MEYDRQSISTPRMGNTHPLRDMALKCAGNARFWLDQVRGGFRPHLDGKDNTVAFVAFYEKRMSLSEAIIEALRPAPSGTVAGL